jgi:mannose-1-phosphate guanylyltransferase / mannose-6-phosphate isomerase
MRNETFVHLEECEQRFSDWLFLSALPLWNSKGIDLQAGGFHETIGMDGTIQECPRRARVQGRQSFVFALAGKLGWSGPWRAGAEHGLEYLDCRYRSGEGLYHTQVLADGAVFDPAVMTYDQAFVLLAAAQLYEMRRDREDLKTFARSLMKRICILRRCSGGGFGETGARKYLSNPQMHLLEAALFWVPLDRDPIWMEVAGEIVGLALSRFIDAKSGALFEEFGENWFVPEDTETLSIEPGHQFEWAWLLEKWAVLTEQNEAHIAAQALFGAGKLGVDDVRNVAIDELDHEFKPRRDTARLWPQTERLKAAAILYDSAKEKAATEYEKEVVSAAESLWRYLEVPLKGLWRDKMLPDGSFVDEPAPASSFYHIIMGVDALAFARNSGIRRHGIQEV